MPFYAGAATGNIEINASKAIAAFTDIVKRCDLVTAKFHALEADSARVTASFRRMSESISKIALPVGIATGAVTAFAGKAVKSAMDFAESENLFEVAMGKMADSTREWSESVANKFQSDAGVIREQVGTFNLMLSSMGFTADAAAKMSKNLTVLGYDLQSLKNISADEAFLKLQSGITGEAEPLKRFGILVNDTTVQAYAWKNGIAAVGQELPEQQKVVARYGVMISSTLKNAQGDLIRTIDSPANRLRALNERLGAFSKLSGALLLSDFSSAIAGFDKVARAANSWIVEHDKAAAAIAKTVAVAAAGTASIMALAVGRGLAASALTNIGKVGVEAFRLMTTPLAVVNASILGLAGAVVAAGAGVYAFRAVWKQNTDGVKDMLFDVGKTISGVFSAAWEPVKDFLQKLWSGATSVFDGIISFAKNMANSIIAEFKASWVYLNTLTNTWSLDAAAKAAASVETVDVIGPMFDRAKKKIGEIGAVVADGVNTWAYEMKEGADIFGEEAGKLSNNIRKQFAQDLKEFAPELKKLLDEAFGANGQGLGNFKPYSYDLEKLNDLLRGAAEQMTKAGAAGKKASDALGELRTKIDPVYAATQRLRDALKISGIISADKTALGVDIFNDLSSSFDKIPGSAERAYQSLAKLDSIAASGFNAERIKQFNDNLEKQIEESLGDLDAAKQYGDRFKNAFESFNPNFGAPAEMASKVADAMQYAKGAGIALDGGEIGRRFFQDFGKQGAPFIDASARELRTKFGLAGDDVANEMKKAFGKEKRTTVLDSIGGQFRDIGQGIQDFGEKFNANIIEKSGAVANAIGGIAAAYKRFEDAKKSTEKISGFENALNGVGLFTAAITAASTAFGLFSSKSQEVKTGFRASWTK